jgi:hypothetical protein
MMMMEFYFFFVLRKTDVSKEDLDEEHFDLQLLYSLEHCTWAIYLGRSENGSRKFVHKTLALYRNENT